MYSDQQQAEFKEQFGERRRRQLLITLPLLAVFGLYVWMLQHPGASLVGLSPATVTVAALVFVACFVVFTLSNWRCPACHGYLGKGISPRFCRKCGVQLSD